MGAYVEYLGLIDNTLKDKLLEEVNKVANQIIQEEKERQEVVWVKMCTYEEAEKVLGEIPPYIKQGSDLRVVKLTQEDGGCPCGGTHVRNVSDIEKIVVTKIVKKGKNTRVSYVL